MDKIITISKGPQFRDGKVSLLFILIIFGLVISIGLFIQREFIGGIIFLFISYLMFDIAIDIQGLEINVTKRVYRKYKLKYFMKFGKWDEYIGYNSLIIERDSYLITEAHGRGSSSTVEREQRFLIYLVNDDADKNIILEEDEDYDEASKKAVLLSEKIGLPFNA